MTGEDLAQEKLVALVRELYARTFDGRVTWKEEVPDVAFSVSLPHYTVVVASADEDGQAPYNIEIVNDQGVITEAYTTRGGRVLVDLSAAVDDLFQTVRRMTSSAGAAIDDVMRDLLDAEP